MKKVASIAAVLREIVTPKELLDNVTKWLEQHPVALNMEATFLSRNENASMALESHICQAVGLIPVSQNERAPLYANITRERDLITKLLELPHKNAATVMKLPDVTLGYTFDICCVLLNMEKEPASQLLFLDRWPEPERKKYHALILNGNFVESTKLALRYVRTKYDQ